MVTVEEELGRAVQGAFTRPMPKSAGARMRYLVRRHQGSTQQVAALLGISRRTVERYVKDQIKHPRPQLATRLLPYDGDGKTVPGSLESEVRTRWQPQIRARARQKAATTDGIMIDVQARFGYTAAAGSTDQSRIRHLTLALPPRRPPPRRPGRRPRRGPAAPAHRRSTRRDLLPRQRAPRPRPRSRTHRPPRPPVPAVGKAVL